MGLLTKTKFTVTPKITTAAKVIPIDHDKLQKMSKKKKRQEVFGLHTPLWKPAGINCTWDIRKRKETPKGFLTVEFEIAYSAEIHISKRVDKNTKCYKMLKAHEMEHHQICIAGTKSCMKDCVKVLKKQTKLIEKKYKRDFQKIADNEQKILRELGLNAFKVIDKDYLLKVAEKSLAIDTPSHYEDIYLECHAYFK